MGGSTTTVQAAPAPSVSAQMGEYVASLPALYQVQMQYNPQLVAQELSLLQQYGGQFGEAYKTAQEAMYPETSAIQETLANQALQGATATEMPDWMKAQYKSDIAANLGTSAGSPIGADYTSRAMQQQLYNQQNYYRDLGLSLAGRQPLAQPQVQGQTNWMQGYTPQQALNYGSNTYGSWAGSMNSMYQPSIGGQIAGGLAGGIGTFLGSKFLS